MWEQRRSWGGSGPKLTLQTTGRNSAPSQGEDRVFTWPPEKPVGQLEFPSWCGMIIRVLKDNWRVKFEGWPQYLGGDSAATAWNKPSGGYGDTAVSRRVGDQPCCWTTVLIPCVADVALASEESFSAFGFVMYSGVRVCCACLLFAFAAVDGPNYGLSFKINTKPLSWFMQPGSWATETSKTGMRQCWRLKPRNQHAFVVKRHGKHRSERTGDKA